MNATHGTETAASTVVTMASQATWFIEQPTLLGHQTVKSFEADFRAFIEQMIPQIEKLAAAQSPDDVPANVALAAIAEARSRMGEPEAAGLQGEVERVKRLARSVVSLVGHHDSLAGLTMCLLCDRPIAGEDAWEPYDVGRPPGGAARSGRVHTACATRLR
ncbi:DUF6415 family natural product biosynthesis protein [Streptomyces sp. NPDC007991]|uniref:DUF6415 family natural product biosynthesis protein n=1 Tax=Streptomyces sp. NPDC007991 TaxID=3364803 RepID=UPI0036E1F3C5